MVPGQAPADRFGRPEKTKGGSESLGADIAREVLVQGLAEGFGTEGLLQGAFWLAWRTATTCW